MYIMHIDIWYMTESLALQLRLFLTELNTVVLLYLNRLWIMFLFHEDYL